MDLVHRALQTQRQLAGVHLRHQGAEQSFVPALRARLGRVRHRIPGPLADDGTRTGALLGRQLREVPLEELIEGHIRTLKRGARTERPDEARKPRICLLQFPFLQHPALRRRIDARNPGPRQQRARERRMAVNELGTELDRAFEMRLAACPDAPADAVARFQQKHAPAGTRQAGSGDKACGARANDDDVRRYGGWRPGGWGLRWQIHVIPSVCSAPNIITGTGVAASAQARRWPTCWFDSFWPVSREGAYVRGRTQNKGTPCGS